MVEPKPCACGCPLHVVGSQPTKRYATRKCKDRAYLRRTRSRRRAPLVILAEKPCACGCKRTVQVTSSQPRKRFFSDACQEKHHAETRRKPLVARPRTALAYEMRKEVAPGLCIYCELRPAKRLTCADKDCIRDYMRDYAAGRRREKREKSPPAPLEPRLCDCGCGTTFTPRTHNQRFISRRHKKDKERRQYSESRRLRVLSEHERVRLIQHRWAWRARGAKFEAL